MYSIYKNSRTLRQIERSYDLVTSRNNDSSFFVSRKRSRDDYELETVDTIFNNIILNIANNDLFPTLRTLMLESFYVLLGNNPNNTYIEDLLFIVSEFREIITKCDMLFNNGDYMVIKGYIEDELMKLLLKAQHPVMLFHLSL